MYRLTTYLIAAVAFVLAGCESGAFDNAMQKTVREKLKDPDSAKWGEQIVYKNRACLQVNSKNSYGGYTGNKTAWLKDISFPGGNWYLEDIDEKGCYNHVLRELSERDDAEKEFEAKVVNILKSKGLQVTEYDLSGVNHHDASVNSCLKAASKAMTAFRIASDYKDDKRAEWEKTATDDLGSIHTSTCKS